MDATALDLDKRIISHLEISSGVGRFLDNRTLVAEQIAVPLISLKPQPPIKEGQFWPSELFPLALYYIVAGIAYAVSKKDDGKPSRRGQERRYQILSEMKSPYGVPAERKNVGSLRYSKGRLGSENEGGIIYERAVLTLGPLLLKPKAFDGVPKWKKFRLKKHQGGGSGRKVGSFQEFGLRLNIYRVCVVRYPLIGKTKF